MRALWISLFGLSNVLASIPLLGACAQRSRFSPQTCEIMRLVGLWIVFVLLAWEMTMGKDTIPLAWTAALTIAVAMARPSAIALSSVGALS